MKAEPDKGFILKGWYKGEYIGIDGDHIQVSRPLDVTDPENLLSADKEYTFYLDEHTVICPVFEEDKTPPTMEYSSVSIILPEGKDKVKHHQSYSPVSTGWGVFFSFCACLGAAA